MTELSRHRYVQPHLTGEALYVDDLPLSRHCLVGHVVASPLACANLSSFDLSAARSLPGVQAVLCAADIPGENQMGAVVEDELCLADREVSFRGQALFLIAAESAEICREAERVTAMTLEPLAPILTVDEAIASGSALGPWRKVERGDVERALREAPRVLTGELRTGAQEHWYLETQVCLCVPGEGQGLLVYSASQHPAGTQTAVARVLGLPLDEVVVKVLRLGGAFGGKESQASKVACWTALLARATQRPVKIRLARTVDHNLTGKRHPFLIRYEAGFDEAGTLLALRMELNSDGGAANDLGQMVLERALLHADNAYYVPHLCVTGRVWKTNHPPNTAMRGFGAPQAMAAVETVVDRIARVLQKDPVQVRRHNFYGAGERAHTHYGERVMHNRLGILFRQLLRSSDYAVRRRRTAAFNAEHEFQKKGLALTPVKWGISITTSFLNQAGAAVQIYTDGTILISHGGVEMGQGLHAKILAVAAAEFGVSRDTIRIQTADTSTVPNASATVASTGSDLNGMAVATAIRILKRRISDCLCRHFNTAMRAPGTEPTRPAQIRFEDNWLYDGRHPERRVRFADAAALCHLYQISLSATGYYRTPSIWFDRDKGQGEPFDYYAFGMAVTEVLLDVLTGDVQVVRADLLQDVGTSLDPAVDKGQVVGGYVQGLGWCTMEEIRRDENGRLLTEAGDTYKIPTIGDIPPDFRADLLQGYPNPKTIGHSKAVGEPPLALALSAWLAIKDAVAAVGGHRFEPAFALPATNEVILLSIEDLKRRMTADR